LTGCIVDSCMHSLVSQTQRCEWRDLGHIYGVFSWSWKTHIRTF